MEMEMETEAAGVPWPGACIVVVGVTASFRFEVARRWCSHIITVFVAACRLPSKSPPSWLLLAVLALVDVALPLALAWLEDKEEEEEATTSSKTVMIWSSTSTPSSRARALLVRARRVLSRTSFLLPSLADISSGKPVSG